MIIKEELEELGFDHLTGTTYTKKIAYGSLAYCSLFHIQSENVTTLIYENLSNHIIELVLKINSIQDLKKVIKNLKELSEFMV